MESKREWTKFKNQDLTLLTLYSSDLGQFFYSAEDGGDCVREEKFEAVDNFLFYSIIKAIIKM